MSVLLLHGLGNSNLNIRSYVPKDLPGIVAPDVRAHGENPEIGAADDFSLAQLARECGDALQASWDGKPVTIVGVSMGAAIALRIALSGRFPIDRVAFLRPSFTTESLPHNLAVFPVIAELLDRHSPAEALKHLRDTGIYGEIRNESEAGAAALEGQITQPGAWDRRIRLLEIPRNKAYDAGELATLNAPSVVLASPRDPVHPMHLAEEWRDGLGCRMLVSPARDDGVPAVMQWYREQLATFLVGIPT